MNQKHTHELAGAYMMGLLDYDTIKLGCHECGPQWVVTVNWVDRTLQISWVNVPWGAYFDGKKGTLQVDSSVEQG